MTDHLFLELTLCPNAEQEQELQALFSRFADLCRELEAQAPEELKRFAELYKWAYPWLRRKGVWTPLIGRVIGKVSSARVRGVKTDCTAMLYDRRMFTLKDGVLRLRLLHTRQKVEFHTVGQRHADKLDTAQMQSGLLKRQSGYTLFVLKMVC